MKIKFSITNDDCEKWISYGVQRPEIRNQLRRNAFIIGLAASLLIFFSVKSKTQHFGASSIIALIIFIVMYPGSRAVLEKQLKKDLLGALEADDASKPAQPMFVEITRTGVNYQTSGASSKTQWSAIDEIGITDRHIFLIPSAGSTILIPLREFSSSEKQESFVATLKDYAKDICIQRAP